MNYEEIIKSFLETETIKRGWIHHVDLDNDEILFISRHSVYEYISKYQRNFDNTENYFVLDKGVLEIDSNPVYFVKIKMINQSKRNYLIQYIQFSFSLINIDVYPKYMFDSVKVNKTSKCLEVYPPENEVLKEFSFIDKFRKLFSDKQNVSIEYNSHGGVDISGEISDGEVLSILSKEYGLVHFEDVGRILDKYGNYYTLTSMSRAFGIKTEDANKRQHTIDREKILVEHRLKKAYIEQGGDLTHTIVLAEMVD